MTSETPAGQDGKEQTRPTRRLPRSRVSVAERRQLREDVRDAHFPVALRGYDRAAVDRYVQQVNRLIAELEISSSPESAVRHALEEVSEETSGLLQHAYETADEITARSRAKADDRLQQAEREAEEVREGAAHEAQETRETAHRETQELRAAAAREAQELRETAASEAQQARAKAQREVEEMRAAAEARVLELDRNFQAIWRERRRLIDDMSAVAGEQLEIVEAAVARFPRAEATAEHSVAEDEPAAEEEHGAADDSTSAPPKGPQ